MADLGQNTYSAELFVASQFTYAGWNTYFPQRDKGFDFIVSKKVDGRVVIRPVQVKGKYPEEGTKPRTTYGFDQGPLSQIHPEMVLAMPFYESQSSKHPEFVAYMPPAELKSAHRCEPAQLTSTGPKPRSYFTGFVGRKGLALLENPDWADTPKENYPWAG